MLKLIIVIAGLYLMGLTTASSQTSPDRLILVDSTFCTIDSIPYTGEYVVHYPTGHVKANYRFLDGTRHFTSSHFHPNGRLYKIEHHDHNKPVGLWQEWDINGVLLSSATFVNGERSGHWRIRHPHTDLTLIMDFSRNDLISAYYE